MKTLIRILCAGSMSGMLLAQPADQGVVTAQQPPGACQTFYEIDGIVSMEAEHASFVNGWSRASLPFDTVAMQSEGSHAWKGGVLRFDIEFKTPGRYALWVLARKGREGGRYSSNDFKVWLDRDLSLGEIPRINHRETGKFECLIDADGYQPTPHPKDNAEKRESELNLGQSHSFTWSSSPKDGKGPAFWHVKTSGHHHLEIVTGEEYSYAIDKLVLTLDNRHPPEGRGPVETSRPDVVPMKEGFDPAIVIPPSWAFGVLYGGYTNQQESTERVRQIIDHDYPIDGYWVDSWFWDFTGGGRGPKGYLNFTGDPVAFPDPGIMWSEFEKRKVKGGIWIWDIILQDGNEQVFKEFEEAGAFERTFVNTVTWHNQGGTSLCGQINFEDPVATAYFQQRLKPLFDKGLDFLKLDRGPGVPFARGVFEAIQKYGKETRGRAFIIQHVGDLHDPLHKSYPTKWTGDSEIAWTLPDFPNLTHYTKGGLTENIEMVADPHRYDYEVPFLTHDGGGFRIIGSQEFGEELFMRWIQFSIFNPVMEVFQSLFNSHANLAWQFSPRADECYRRLTHLRMRLFPYIYSYAHLTRQTGRKMIQGDRLNKYQYLFGKELLVGPVHQKGATSKQMHLPEGRWIDYWTGQEYQGGRSVTVPAPIDRIPLLVRAGAIIPMRDYARAIELGSNRRLTLEVSPYGESAFTLYEDDGTSNDYLEGGFATTRFSCSESGGRIVVTVDPIEGSYEGLLAEREYRLQVHLRRKPQSVSLNGESLPENELLPGWEYDASRGLVRVGFVSLTSLRSQVALEF